MASLSTAGIPEGAPPVGTSGGWHSDRHALSLGDVYQTIDVPEGASRWRKFMAFFGPGLLVAVGYMDPGNWATDLAGGARYGYLLLTVILFSNFMAMLLQHLSVKLGLATGRDLAQACRNAYSRPVSLVLWVLAEVAIAACDLAEIIGAAIALNLLFGLPLPVGVVLTVLDVFIVLLLQRFGFRWIEAIVGGLIAMIALAFLYEIVVSSPVWGDVALGLLPSPRVVTEPGALYIAVGILGATVMPHNLYLHSAIVQTRKVKPGVAAIRQAIRYATLDSTFALFLAFFVNAAILVLAAATFHGTENAGVADIHDAYTLLTPVLGAPLASTFFAHCPARRRAELDAHRHHCRAGGDGGLPRHQDEAVEAAPAHADDRRGACGVGGHRLRREGHGRAAHPEPGHPVAAALVRRHPARRLHEQPRQDGRVRQRPHAQSRLVGGGRGHRRAQRVPALGDPRAVDDRVTAEVEG